MGKWLAAVATGAAAGLAIVAAAAALLPRPAGVPGLPADDKAEIAEGARLYADHCATCHGAHLEGQPDWQRPGPDGLLPAPPHDPTGHTWQHSDRELYALVAQGPLPFAAKGYRTAMPAFAGQLGDHQIRATIAFIKSTWPAGVRAYQMTQNPGGPSLDSLPGDWQFPPSCSFHFPSETAEGG
jgi:mono/diheme cytochrome c family protein